ncbi:uncharacterized protein LOC105018232 isoform X4 [Esox lucius]|uniref:uncharacterized protein LOC105018232 isoform X4 n=1 Tax=Esox lucius TaxID=8010 RepID=UPI0009731D3E|nr:uncharacterized protein LOC105018232 isoform X4 [Esox lucius]
MARPTSAKTQMSYTKLMELDDYEETAGPPSKKSLFFVKDPHKDSLCKVRGDPMSSHPIREQRQAAASEQQSFVLNADGISQTERPGEDIDYQPKCTPAQQGADLQRGIHQVGVFKERFHHEVPRTRIATGTVTLGKGQTPAPHYYWK